MNIPIANRSVLRMHVAAIEDKHPIKIVGLLPRGSAGHVLEDDALDLLLSLAGGAEIALGERLGRPVGIVLAGGLRGEQGERVKASARPL
jgi:hypothetical protein